MSEASATELLERMGVAARTESRAAAARLVAIGDLVALRLAEDGGASDHWALDVVDATAIEIAAALNISRGQAASHLRYAHALRVQLPLLGARFIAGDIDEASFRAAVFRTALIVDDELRARVDTHLAQRMPRWGSTTFRTSWNTWPRAGASRWIFSGCSAIPTWSTSPPTSGSASTW